WSVHPARYFLADGCANAPGITNASRRCTLPGWSYETAAQMPGIRPGTGVSAWDGKEWFTPGYSPWDPPPYLVHVDIEAARGSPPPAITAALADAKPARRISDVLLNPARAPLAVSFGWVRWYGIYGR